MLHRRSCGARYEAATSRASGSKGCVATSSVGRPSASSSSVSWTLHDVQLPQSALPVRIRSASAASVASSSGAQGSAAFAFWRSPTERAPLRAAT